MTDGDLRARWLRAYPEGVPPTLDYPDGTLDDQLRRTAASRAPSLAAVFLDTAFSWRQMAEMAGGFAAALHAMGVGPGDRVALALPNCPQMMAGFYGTLLAGAVAVPVNPLYVPREIEVVLKDSGARLLVALDRLKPRVDQVLPGIPGLQVLYTHITDALPGVRGRIAEAMAKRQGQWAAVVGTPAWREVVRPTAPPERRGDPDDLAVLQYTGGTTGIPKGAMLTHRNLVANAHQNYVWTHPEGGVPGPVMAVLPIFHVYGLTTTMNVAVLTGAPVILEPRFDVTRVVDDLRRRRVEVFPATPTMYVAVIREATRRHVDLSSIRACISGSAPLPPDVQQEFIRITGGFLVEGYGLTEASPVTHCNPMNDRNRAGTIGVPFPDTEARIMGEGNRVLGPGEGIGELEVRGPQVMRGYWQHPDETGAVLSEDGWLRTGDLGTVDEDGYFRVVDRKKDVILTGGFSVYPREIEEVIRAHPDVLDAAVFGVPDPYRGEAVAAAVVPREGSALTEEALRAHLDEGLTRYKIPRIIEFRTELPRTAVGKVLRRELRDAHIAASEATKEHA